MKILYVSTHPHLNLAAPSGPGTHMREIIRGFQQQGHDVKIFIAGGEQLQSEQIQQIRFQKYTWKKWVPAFLWNSLKELKLILHNRRMIQSVSQVIEDFKPDFIYERAYAFMDAAAKVAVKKGIPICCEVNAPYPEEVALMNGKGLFHWCSNSAEKNIAQTAHRIVVVSSAMRSYFIDKYDLEETKIIVTPNAVQKSFGAFKEGDSVLLRKRWGILEGDYVIGFVGSIFPYHGVDVLINAYAKLIDQSEFKNIKLLIVGDGESRTTLEENCDRMNIRENVIFTGNVPHKEVASYISVMDVAVMAKSNWYGSPVKIFEYGILGKFIIAPNTVPVHDVMIHGIHGHIVSNENELLDSLNFAISNKSVADKMASTFQHKVINEHSWDAMAKKILDNA